VRRRNEGDTAPKRAPGAGRGAFRVGTSGFGYEEWRGAFYPPDLKSRDMLRWYATQFPSVEINYTFRRIPSAKTIAAWGEAVPDGFALSFKAPMRVTHVQRFGGGAAETAKEFLAALAPLGGRVGPILFQCSDTFAFDEPRVRSFLDALPADRRYAFEFRHPSWTAARAFLESRGASWCVAETDDVPVPDDPLATGPFHYVRLRTSRCSTEHLATWAERIDAALAAGRDVYCYFKHEDTAQGTTFARELDALVERPRGG
jgi:uncharacterized protein YecE (DUF72 family)